MNILTVAEHVAFKAHEGQTDKCGKGYIHHPRRVSAAVFAITDDEEVAAAALLHDVVEDSDVTLEDIESKFGTRVRGIVDALTKRDGESREDYYQRVRANSDALLVKFCDIHDNLSPARLATLPAEEASRLRTKYGRALVKLTE